MKGFEGNEILFDNRRKCLFGEEVKTLKMFDPNTPSYRNFKEYGGNNNMKRFTAVTLAALMVLTVFASLASAASVADTVEIRSNVYTAADLASDNITIGASEFAGFYYNLDDNLTSEVLTILGGTGHFEDDEIQDNSLLYTCYVVNSSYEYTDAEDWYEDESEYPIIGFFAEEYVPLLEKDDPLSDCKADKLAKLLLDSDDKYTVTTGESLDLGDGYTLEAKQVDVDGDKVWLEFSKDGEFIDDEVIDVSDGNSSTAEHTWTVDLDDIEDEDNIVVLKVHVNQVFQGSVDSIAQIEGLWLIDYQNAFTIDDGDEYGELEVQSTDIGETTEHPYGGLELDNDDNTITLSQDSEKSIAEGLYFKVADNSSVTRFYLMKEYTDPGTYEIRGSITTDSFTWNYSNFAGFYYDLDDDVSSETLVTHVTGDRDLKDNDETIPGITYTATIQGVDYEYTDAEEWYETDYQYPIIGFFAEEYIPLFDVEDINDISAIKTGDADKLAKLLLDSDDKYTVTTGESLDLGDGYTLEAKQVDVDGDKVWLEFSKDGEFIDDEVVDVSDGNSSTAEHTWTVDLDDIEDEDDVVVLKVHVNQVFQGSVDSIAQIEGLWLIDYQNAFTIDTDDEYGELEVESTDSGKLVLTNKNDVTLSQDSEKHIAEDMYFKVADSEELRYYPYVERTIGEGEEKPIETETGEEVTTPGVNETEVSQTPVEAETTPVEAETTPAAEATTTEDGGIPGFGIVLGLAGLLAVVYLVRRN